MPSDDDEMHDDEMHEMHEVAKWFILNWEFQSPGRTTANNSSHVQVTTSQMPMACLK